MSWQKIICKGKSISMPETGDHLNMLTDLTFVDCYKHFEKYYKPFETNNPGDKVYKCKNGYILFSMDDVRGNKNIKIDFIQFNKSESETDKHALRELVETMIDDTYVIIALPGIGDYLDKLGLDKFTYKNKYFINVGGNGLVVKNDTDTAAYVKQMGW